MANYIGVRVISIIALIILFITMVLCFVVMNKLDRERFPTLYNIALGSGVATLIIFVACIISAIVLAYKSYISYTTAAFVIGILFGIIILIVGVLMAYISYNLATSPSYNSSIPDDVSALTYAMANACVGIATATLMLFGGILIFLGGTTLLCPTVVKEMVDLKK